MSESKELSDLKLNICINCTKPVNLIVKIPSNKSIKCERCGEIVDKYIEFESCMVFLDCVLLSEKVFRHIIYNCNFKVFINFLSYCNLLRLSISDLQQNHNRPSFNRSFYTLEAKVFPETRLS